jgi:hypothetical protein
MIAFPLVASAYFMLRSFKLDGDDKRDMRLLAIWLQANVIVQLLWSM